MIRVKMATRRQRDIWLYLDILPDPPMVGSSPRSPDMPHCLHQHTKRAMLGDPETIMVFLKHFDTTWQSLLGIGKIYIPRTSKVNDLFPLINERMGWLPWTPLRLYEVTNVISPRTSHVNMPSFPRKSNLARSSS